MLENHHVMWNGNHEMKVPGKNSSPFVDKRKTRGLNANSTWNSDSKFFYCNIQVTNNKECKLKTTLIGAVSSRYLNDRFSISICIVMVIEYGKRHYMCYVICMLGNVFNFTTVYDSIYKYIDFHLRCWIFLF